MDHLRTPFKGVVDDFKGRLACYKKDWLDTCGSGASLSTSETLASTAICGVIHAIFGGQPLLILGVAEPTIIMYTYLYNFAKNSIGKELYLAWAGCQKMILLCNKQGLCMDCLAVVSSCYIQCLHHHHSVYKSGGRTFGMLITVLFIQEAIKGVLSEFRIPKGENAADEKYQFQLLYTNGLLAIIFSFGVLITALRSRKARSWRYGSGTFRSFIADYGVPLMVVVWTALSYSVPRNVPSGVPRRLFCPLPWESESLYHWTVIKDMAKIPGLHICCINTGCDDCRRCFVDCLDFLLRMVYFHNPRCIPSLAVLKRQLIRKKMVKSAKEGIKQQASHSEIYGRMHEVFIEMEGAPSHTADKELANLKEAVLKHEDGDTNGNFDPERCIDLHLPVRVNEQRISNLLQSILVGLAICVMPVIKMIPTSVLWGYFAYMAIDSLPGNQFWERILLLFVPPGRRFKVIEGFHASFVESVPFKYIFMFTLFQLAYLLICFGITWIPIAGILFPLPFFLLISIREHLLPKVFPPNHLQELDAAEYEEIIGHSVRTRSLSLTDREPPDNDGDEGAPDVSSAEILDEMTTRRGELKHRLSQEVLLEFKEDM
ncbi:hypothetical protein DH2020_006136 [Rehmannia glutinosa]|uniref:Bicarbonate transporter-like transmembrane domain-containing protein n=1 Tax=Rehmannia glutinosa TaxID=99300 RepID=A0ABR0XI17_REHGL